MAQYPQKSNCGARGGVESLIVVVVVGRMFGRVFLSLNVKRVLAQVLPRDTSGVRVLATAGRRRGGGRLQVVEPRDKRAEEEHGHGHVERGRDAPAAGRAARLYAPRRADAHPPLWGGGGAGEGESGRAPV